MPKNTTQEVSAKWKPRYWVIPPGLTRVLDRFKIRCQSIIEKFEKERSTPLLIHGPSGTGKSMFCDYFIFEFQSKTKNKKVIYINCAAIPETLLESELFGYEKGSHNLALKTKKGYFEEAANGVIVLEEIGEMKKDLQAKLLIVVENKIFSRLGSTKALPFEAQIIATTNADIDKFRSDLWYRFDIFKVPPIHKRREDILFYFDHFDHDLIKIISKGTAFSLLAYNWPGNVREIERVCNSIKENISLAKERIKLLESLNDPDILPNILSNQKELMWLDEGVTNFAFDKSEKLETTLKERGVDTKQIKKALNKCLLDFDSYNSLFYEERIASNVFSSLPKDKKDNFEYVFNDYFSLAYSGLLIFCKIFFQDADSNRNLLDMSSFKFPESDLGQRPHFFSEKVKTQQPFDIYANIDKKSSCKKTRLFIALCGRIYNSALSEFGFWPDHYQNVLCESLKYLTGLKNINKENLSDIFNLFETNRSNKFLASLFGKEPETETIEELPIETISLDELKELYYETLCNKIGTSHGSQKTIAEIAGRSKGAISQALKKYELKLKFSKQNFEPRKRLIILK